MAGTSLQNNGRWWLSVSAVGAWTALFPSHKLAPMGCFHNSRSLKRPSSRKADDIAIVAIGHALPFDDEQLRQPIASVVAYFPDGVSQDDDQ